MVIPYPIFGGEKQNPVRAAQASDSCQRRKTNVTEADLMPALQGHSGLQCSCWEFHLNSLKNRFLQITLQLEVLTEDVKGLTTVCARVRIGVKRPCEPYLKQRERTLKSQEDKMNLLSKHCLQGRSASVDASMSDVSQFYGILQQERSVPAPATAPPFSFQMDKNVPGHMLSYRIVYNSEGNILNSSKVWRRDTIRTSGCNALITSASNPSRSTLSRT